MKHPFRLFGMDLIEELDFNETLEKYKGHSRIKVFYHKGLACYICEKQKAEKAFLRKDGDGGLHVDLFTQDLHLMTVDHVIPKSKGGTNDLYNLEPCCFDCNMKKGDRVIFPIKKLHILLQNYSLTIN